MNKKKIIIAMLVVISIMAVGYSYFATRLNINATGSIDGSWNVYFAGIEVGPKSETARVNGTPTASGTTANMDVSLKVPGDYINFNITLLNAGNVDAIIEDIKAQAEGTEAIIFSISGLKIGDKLAGGTNASKVITVKLEYDTSITSQPSELTKRLTVDIDAVQDIGQSITPTDPSIIQPVSLSKQILKNNVAQSDENIDFSKTSTEDGTSGLYYTSDLSKTENGKVSYYFRGPVENNFVAIGYDEVEEAVWTYYYYYVGINGEVYKEGYTSLAACEAGLALEDAPEEGQEYNAVCLQGDWMGNITKEVPILWRIVRINEDGSVRLIKQNSIDGSGYSYGGSSDNAEVGYMYGEVAATGENAYNRTHTNTHDSKVKEDLDEWYEDNLINYSSILADAGFCNDRSVAPSAGTWHADDTALGYERETTYYGPYNRLVNTKQPQFKCPNEERDLFTLKESSKGNKALDYPIGLLSVDELMYAGGAADSSSNFYLSNIVEGAVETMSPNFMKEAISVRVVALYEGGIISSFFVGDGGPKEPVINLKGNVMATLEGTGEPGSITNPYVIQTN